MLRERLWIVLMALSIVLTPFVVTAAQYTIADIVGTWENNGLASGSDAPWWIRGPITFNTDGSWSAIFEEYPSETGPASGTFTISADGTVSLPWENAAGGMMVCNMDAGKTVMVCTHSWPASLPSTTAIAILTKKGPPYGQTDLAGTWGVNVTASGPGAPWWEYGTVAIAGDGSFSGLLQEYGSNPDDVSGIFNISAEGILTWPGGSGDAHIRWTMDSGKTVIVGTSTWVRGSPGTSEFSVLTKRATSYSQADVSGIWAYHSLVSGGPYAPGWYRGPVTVDSSGLATFTATDNTGTQEIFTKSMIISSDGSFTDVAPAGGECNMDAGKTVIACTITETTGDGTVEMPIFVKTSSFTDVAPGYWAGSYIDALYGAHLTAGYGGTAEYKPEMDVTREQMAVFIIRALDQVPPDGYCGGTSPFSDVPVDRWSCKYVKRLVELGITAGIGQGLFGPEDTVTREQMAAFLTRALNEVPSDGYCGTVDPFTDVPYSWWSCKYVKRLVELGITVGIGEGLYGPGNPVTRAQMAVFLSRAFLGM